MLKTALKRVVIMQPTCLPWVGYFDLIDQSDAFVFLDNVQFEKQSWQQRNRIRTPNGLEWVTIPVLIKGRFGQVIKDVEITKSVPFDKFIKQVRHNYSRSEYFTEFFEEFASVFEAAYNGGNLCDFNIAIIEWLSLKLSIAPVFLRSSRLKASGKRSELLVNILKELDSGHYISPAGSAVYLDQEHDRFENENISVFYQNYVHPQYYQVYKPFVAYASCLDLLFNAGEKSIDIIRSGRREPVAAKKGTVL
jgi:hypothetical protein